MCFNPFPSEWVLRALTDFTLSNARRFYLSMGNLLDGKGLTTSKTMSLLTILKRNNWARQRVDGCICVYLHCFVRHVNKKNRTYMDIKFIVFRKLCPKVLLRNVEKFKLEKVGFLVRFRCEIAEKCLHIICVSLNNKRGHCITPRSLLKRMFNFSQSRPSVGFLLIASRMCLE